MEFQSSFFNIFLTKPDMFYGYTFVCFISGGGPKAAAALPKSGAISCFSSN
jgi:hypothetical protein